MKMGSDKSHFKSHETVSRNTTFEEKEKPKRGIEQKSSAYQLDQNG